MRGTPCSLRLERRGIVVLLAAALFAACGEKSTGPSSGDLYLQFRANGTQVEFTDQASLLGHLATNSQLLTVTGYDGTTNAGVQIYDTSPITTRTYSGYGPSSTGTGVVGVILHYHTPDDILFQPGTPVVATAIITEITESRVAGTFSGTLRADGEPDLAITDGRFLVRRVN